jgi:MarR-like DNA-binding transcriptional regulator SgrR of sgrS sRNA
MCWSWLAHRMHGRVLLQMRVYCAELQAGQARCQQALSTLQQSVRMCLVLEKSSASKADEMRRRARFLLFRKRTLVERADRLQAQRQTIEALISRLEDVEVYRKSVSVLRAATRHFSALQASQVLEEAMQLAETVRDIDAAMNIDITETPEEDLDAELERWIAAAPKPPSDVLVEEDDDQQPLLTPRALVAS